jgi:LacI family transcriptional regulator
MMMLPVTLSVTSKIFQGFHRMNRRSVSKVTIRQVAKEAGVSTQTVSRVMNNIPEVLPETRQRVLDVVARLGYRPNVIARSLTQNRSYTLGVVSSGIEYYGPSRTLVGIEQKANELGYSLSLSLLPKPETDDVTHLLDSLISRQVDGILWATQEIGANLSWLEREQLSIPLVFIEMSPRPGVASVNVDSCLGVRLAMHHLLEQGYRRIGVITGPLSWWAARERLQGWRLALVEAGLDVDDRQIVNGDWSTGSGAHGLKQLVEQYPKMEAVLVCNDQMALGVLQTCRQLGRRVPEDLAIVGYDDIPEAEYFWPPLTTVRQNLTELGGTAVELLIKMIAAKQQGDTAFLPECVWLKPELIVRNSSMRGSVS